MMDFHNCPICGFMKPVSYEECPACVHGIKPNSVGRVLCRTCSTIVGEHYILEGENYHKYIEKCDYCDPPPNATDEDIVSRCHCWVYDPVEPPKKLPIIKTREQVRKSIESSKKLAEQLRALWEGHDGRG